MRATYFRDERRRTEPYASPLLAPDLTGLPPAVVVTAEYGMLRAEGDAYPARPAEAGVDVVHRGDLAETWPRHGWRRCSGGTFESHALGCGA